MSDKKIDSLQSIIESKITKQFLMIIKGNDFVETHEINH